MLTMLATKAWEPRFRIVSQFRSAPDIIDASTRGDGQHLNANALAAKVLWQWPMLTGCNGLDAPHGRMQMANIERSISEAEELFVSAGQAKIRAEGLDLRRKRVRATLFCKYKGDGHAAGASEQMAEADPVYEMACIDWETAAMEAETLRAQAEAKRLRFEAWRTQQSTARAQMNLR